MYWMFRLEETVGVLCLLGIFLTWCVRVADKERDESVSKLSDQVDACCWLTLVAVIVAVIITYIWS